jgi:hypothetical protein
MTEAFPLYQRRQFYSDGGTSIKENQYVVPYNPILLMKYQCHMNVEVCSSVKSVKYIFKYIYKGHDAAIIKFFDGAVGLVDVDEIRAFQESRYVSPPEALWRLYEYRMNDLSHTVIRLPVHEEDEETIYYEPDETLTMPDLRQRSRSQLLGFFHLNQTDTYARQFTYSQIPLYYIWKEKTWIRRQKTANKVIVRLHNVSPHERDRFAIRLMLLHRSDVRSFRDLKLGINGESCETYAEAASSWGLMDNSSEWRACLDEAVTFQMPTSLRLLFASICWASPLADIRALWDEYREFMIEDYMREHSQEVSEQIALLNIARAYQANTSSGQFMSFGLPLDPGFRPPNSSTTGASISIQESTEISQRSIESLNEQQRNAFNDIMRGHEHPSGGNRFFFLDGPGGSGKTYLYNTLLHTFRSRGLPFIAVAWTGAAAMLLLDGQTSHYAFKLPLAITDCTSLRVNRRSPTWNRLESAKIIIWDEITLVSRHAMNAVDNLLRFITGIDEPFGSKLMVVGGDFRQCLPVMRHAHRSAIIENTIKHSRAWSRVKRYTLSVNMRTTGTQESFNKWLLNIGEGKCSDGVDLDPAMIVDLDGLIDFTFGDFLQYQEPLQACSSAILCPKNDETFAVNDKITGLQTGRARQYFSTDVVHGDSATADNALYPSEYLNSLNLSSMPPHKLTLKVGTPIMLLRNIDVKNKLTNGTRLIVKDLRDHLIIANVVKGDGVREDPVMIPRIDFLSDESEFPFVLRRRQFPVRVAFAMTINKSQGQTLRKVGLCLDSECFSHGQLYVALSRVKNPESLKVYLGEKNAYRTANVVYREIFNDE